MAQRKPFEKPLTFSICFHFNNLFFSLQYIVKCSKSMFSLSDSEVCDYTFKSHCCEQRFLTKRDVFPCLKARICSIITNARCTIYSLEPSFIRTMTAVISNFFFLCRLFINQRNSYFPADFLFFYFFFWIFIKS